MKHVLSLALLLGLGSKVSAQTSFSLKEAIVYGIHNHTLVKNAQLDVQSADARVKEITALGLPQINGQFQLTDNVIIPRFFVPAKTFDPKAAEGEVSAVKFGVQYSAQAGVGVSQLLFDGSYLLGMQAAKVYKELAQKNQANSKVGIAENIAKAYYLVLVNEERMKLLDLNIGRLDSLLHDTRIMNQNGFVEKLDVDRLEVAANNLRTERQNVGRLQESSIYLLKFQMGMPLREAIILSEKLATIQANEDVLSLPDSFDYSHRSDYNVLKTQTKLAELDLKNQRMGYYPRVAANASYGYSFGSDQFNIFTKPWFDLASIGLSVQIPIFDSYLKRHKIAQSQFSLEKAKNGLQYFEQGIDLQIKSAQIQQLNSIETLKEQQKNLTLAQEIVRVTKLKYQQGLGTNLEVINAESAYKEAQTNYYQTRYNVLVTKIELDKATGKLYQE